MYVAFACFVLFDARGRGEWLNDDHNIRTYTFVATIGAVALLALAYIPRVVYRPHLVDALCTDILAIVAHGVGAGLVGTHDRILMHGCALHCACFILERRFLVSKQATVPPVLIHTVAFMLLAASYVYGPRITDIKSFVLASMYPHALEMLAYVLGQVHTVAVAMILDTHGGAE